MTLVELAVAGGSFGATIVGGVWAVMASKHRDVVERMRSMENEFSKLIARVFEVEKQLAVDQAIYAQKIEQLQSKVDESRNFSLRPQANGARLPSAT